jgi:hypothetical protein
LGALGAKIPEIPPDTEVIILAGDIAAAEGALRYVGEVAKAHPNPQVLFVAGIHPAEMTNPSINTGVCQ